MAVSNLYHVTNTLTNLIEFQVLGFLRRDDPAATLDVTAMPPEKLGDATRTLNLHLFHVMEDASHKNDPGIGSGPVPIRHQPLPLLLHYILTAHHSINDTFDAEVQQQLMGLAMKAMHDHPLVDDDLEVFDGVALRRVMVDPMRNGDNHVEMSLRPLTAEESMGFWSAEQSATTRLSAYYEVRTVLLEPEEPTTSFGRVFDVGLFVSPTTAPVLDTTVSHVRFTAPAATGFGVRTLEVRPARAAMRATPVPPAPDLAVNRVEVRGSGLAGDGSPGAARLVLRNSAWTELDPAVRSAPVDPDLNPTWNVTIDERTATFDVQGTLRIDDGAGGTRDLTVSPGIHTVAIESRRRIESPSGHVRTSSIESNRLAFSIGPYITSASTPDVFDRITLNLEPEFDLTAGGEAVQLVVDGVVHDETLAFSGVLSEDVGLFLRSAHAITFQPRFDATVAGAHPVRLVVDGAEAQPFWIEIP